MEKRSRRNRLLLYSAAALLALAGGYAYQRSKFIQKANDLFDPQHKAFHGVLIPWPIGHPTLVGRLDPETDRRIRTTLAYESGSITTNGMTLVIYPSDGTYEVRAD